MKKYLILIMIISAVAAPGFAGLEEMGMGARPLGMADVFVAVADDASSMTANPAGLATVLHPEFLATNKQMLGSLSDGSKIDFNSAAYVHPTSTGRKEAWAFSYQSFTGANYFKDTAFRTAYARPFSLAQTSGSSPLLIGLGLNYFSRKYESSAYLQNALDDSGVASNEADPYFAKNGMAESRLGLDLGFLYQAGLHKTLGLSFVNAIQKEINSDSPGAKKPMMVRMGWAYRPDWGGISAELRRVKRLSSQTDTEAAIGLEKQYSMSEKGKLTFRCGYGVGSRDFKNVSTGFSAGWKSFRLDYAFVIPVTDLKDSGANHTFSFSLFFEKSVAQKTVSEKKPVIQVAALNPQPAAEGLRERYLDQKAAGASIPDRLNFLQEIIKTQGAEAWVIEELSAL